MSAEFLPIRPEESFLIVENSPLRLPNILKIVLAIGIILGFLGLFLGLTTKDPRSTWLTFQANTVFWFVTAAASSGFSAVFQICNAQWVRPLRRIYESTYYFVAFSVIPLVVVYLFGRDYIFEWSTKEVHGKEFWLNPHFVYARDILAVLLLFLVIRTFVRASLRRDAGVLRSRVIKNNFNYENNPTKELINFENKYCINWKKDPRSEVAKINNSLNKLSPLVVITYAFFTTLIAFDQVMSIEPHWYSTLFGAFVFMCGVYGAMAWVGIAQYLLRSLNPLFKKKVFRVTLHDQGKLLFGFGIFWAYLFWSHYLPLWYSNMPELTSYTIPRFRLEPWHSFGWGVVALCFIIPFFIGLSRDFKQIPLGLCLTSLIVMSGLLACFYVLLTPTLFPSLIPLGFSDILITIGFFSVFVLLSVLFLSRVPLMPFGDLVCSDVSTRDPLRR